MCSATKRLFSPFTAPSTGNTENFQYHVQLEKIVVKKSALDQQINRWYIYKSPLPHEKRKPLIHKAKTLAHLDNWKAGLFFHDRQSEAKKKNAVIYQYNTSKKMMKEHNWQAVFNTAFCARLESALNYRHGRREPPLGARGERWLFTQILSIPSSISKGQCKWSPLWIVWIMSCSLETARLTPWSRQMLQDETHALGEKNFICTNYVFWPKWSSHSIGAGGLFKSG